MLVSTKKLPYLQHEGLTKEPRCVENNVFGLYSTTPLSNVQYFPLAVALPLVEWALHLNKSSFCQRKIPYLAE